MKDQKQLRYTLCINFNNSTTGWNVARIWDVSEDFKSKSEMQPYLGMIDDTVKRAVIYDNANKTFETLKG